MISFIRVIRCRDWSRAWITARKRSEQKANQKKRQQWHKRSMNEYSSWIKYCTQYSYTQDALHIHNRVHTTHSFIIINPFVFVLPYALFQINSFYFLVLICFQVKKFFFFFLVLLCNVYFCFLYLRNFSFSPFLSSFIKIINTKISCLHNLQLSDSCMCWLFLFVHNENGREKSKLNMLKNKRRPRNLKGNEKKTQHQPETRQNEFFNSSFSTICIASGI